MVSIGTPRPAEMPRHPADHTTAGRQRWESKDPSSWERTFGHSRRNEKGRTKYVLRNGKLEEVRHG
jgi:hypothetical protein